MSGDPQRAIPFQKSDHVHQGRSVGQIFDGSLDPPELTNKVADL
jgi:hypothetical protein